MIYKASLDKTAKIITLAVTFLFAAIICWKFIDSKSHYSNFQIPIVVGLISIYAGAYIFRPVHYELTQTALLIRRPVVNVTINPQQIKRATVLDRKTMGWVMRTFGVGGLFGFYGYFTNAKFGQMTWYATRKDQVVLIETFQGKKIVVSPDNPDQFLKALEHISHLKQ
ncbi:PH domain-containing protein [Pedobacter sp. AW1-32]|uniref:PH domain-containing protein n=1 Tax=Pedobacter sp. AW1-32 TaxID=3383026 RepID=UPI003FF0176F